MTTATFDISLPETWGAGLNERLKALREADPVHWDAKNEIFVLTRHADVVHVSKHPELFCSGQGTRPKQVPPLSIIDTDGKRHTQIRSLINKGFTPRMTRQWAEDFRALTREAVAEVGPKGACDFVLDVSVPLPLKLIARMIGIEEERYADFHRWSDHMMGGAPIFASGDTHLRAATAAAEYIAYIQEVMRRRREDPREDLVSKLIQAADEGVLGTGATAGQDAESAMAGDELLQFLVLLLVAGNETTRNAITGGVAALIENPDQRQRLIDDPELMPRAVNEVVRYVSPVLNFVRTATEDTELGGKTVRKGQRVMMVYPAANRDPEVFENPEQFDVGRDAAAHVGFGIGPHYCLGANLARMEIEVVLTEVLAKLPDLKFTDGPPKLEPNDLVRSFTSMPVAFTPTA